MQVKKILLRQQAYSTLCLHKINTGKTAQTGGDKNRREVLQGLEGRGGEAPLCVSGKFPSAANLRITLPTERAELER